MFEDLLRKIKLIQPISIEIPLSQTAFENKLNEVVDTRKYNLFEQFSNNKKVFVGELTSDGFNIRPVKKLFQNNLAYLSWFKGNYEIGSSDKRILTGEISVSKYFPIMILSFMIVAYGSILAFTFSSMTDQTGLIFIFIHGLVMLAIFYFILRRSVKLGKHYMERELFFLTKENN
ncbi:MAG: hypothetical protein Q8L81_17490 [Bacteroidota bacterium]|nr:hypothetical protein [Bacteroidota bacterium]